MDTIRTNSEPGNVTTARTYLPFRDGVANTVGSRTNTYDGFIGLWDGGNTLTNHAQYREYENVNGRWMSPDPYQGSYDSSNPQSFNRYSCVLNNPLSMTDPLGLVTNGSTGGQCSGSCQVFTNLITLGFKSLFSSLFGGSSFHGSLHPRPNVTATYGDLRDNGDGSFTLQVDVSYDASIAPRIGLPFIAPSNSQIKRSALSQKRLRSCSQAVFGNANALTSGNAPNIQFLSPGQISARLGGYLGAGNAEGANDPATNTVFFNNSVFTGNLPGIYYQSNYLHEAGNIISFRLFGNETALGNMFVGPNEYPIDPDSGASYERCIFGQRMQIP
jgi:RHS repeat-associated protein